MDETDTSNKHNTESTDASSSIINSDNPIKLNISPIEAISQSITSNILNNDNNNDNTEFIYQSKNTGNEEKLVTTNDNKQNSNDTAKILCDIENIVQNITNNVIPKHEEQIEGKKEQIESKEEEDSINNQNEVTEIESSEINTGQLEAISKDLVQKIVSDEENTDNSIKSSHSQINISSEISEPRTVIRRQFEKSDASVQFESTDDSIFATSINSPRFQFELEEKNTTNANKGLLEMREELINFARKQSLYKLMAEEYEEAAKIDEVISINMQNLQEDSVSSDIFEQTYLIKQYLNEAQNQKATLEQVHKQRIENFKKMEKQRIEEMQTEHENQRKDFEADWSRSETLKTFNKPSSKLFQIRSQQRAMAISHDFKNARQLKKIGDQMQKEESQKATKKALDTMRTKYMALIAKQEKEMKCMIEYGERRLGQLQVQRDSELKANETHINALERRLKSPKIMKRPRVEISSQSSLKSRTLQYQMPGIITSRTRSQFANFKKGADEKTRLEIKIGDVKRITKPLTPTPRKGEKSALFLFS